MFHFFGGEVCTLPSGFMWDSIFRVANGLMSQKNLVNYASMSQGMLKVRVVDTYAWVTSPTSGIFLEEVAHITLYSPLPEESWIISSEALVRF